MSLITTPHLEAGDEFYEALLNAHEGLSAAESHDFDARLILLLANHIGRHDVLMQALALAARTRPGPAAHDTVAASDVSTASTALTAVPSRGSS